MNKPDNNFFPNEKLLQKGKIGLNIHYLGFGDFFW